jgi:hypothetical protein
MQRWIEKMIQRMLSSKQQKRLLRSLRKRKLHSLLYLPSKELIFLSQIEEERESEQGIGRELLVVLLPRVLEVHISVQSALRVLAMIAAP